MTGETTQVTVRDLREREADVLYAFVLLFTFGQMALIIWDMLSLVRGFAELAALIGIQNPGNIHSFGEMTTFYLGLVGAYIGRNAWQKYKSREDAEEVPHYVFLKMKRGHFYMALWATACFIAYMLKGMGVISRLPHELAITTIGVMGGLAGDKAIRGFLGKRTARQMEDADAESRSAGHGDVVKAYVDKHGRITNRECREITGLKDAQANKVLTKLVIEGALKRKGNGPETYYEKA